MTESPLWLIVGPSWVGDMVMAQCLFRVLRQCDQAPTLHVLAPAWARPLLDRMPEVAESIEMPVLHRQLGLARRRRLARRLAERGYARAIVLPNSWKSALVPWLAGIPLRTGWRGEMRYGLLNDLRIPNKQALPTAVQRYVALAGGDCARDLERIPVPRLSIRAVDVQDAERALGIRKNALRPLLVLCPGAEYGISKQWPAAHFGRLARGFHDRGWDVWLLGSVNDRKACDDTNGFSGRVCQDLSGRTALGQAVDLMSLADLVVSNDSGLMHVAAALDRRLVAVFGSTDPRLTPPLSNKARVVSLGLPCSPCFERECPLKHGDCLKRLGVERVEEAAQSLLHGAR